MDIEVLKRLVQDNKIKLSGIGLYSRAWEIVGIATWNF